MRQRLAGLAPLALDANAILTPPELYSISDILVYQKDPEDRYWIDKSDTSCIPGVVRRLFFIYHA